MIRRGRRVVEDVASEAEALPLKAAFAQPAGPGSGGARASRHAGGLPAPIFAFQPIISLATGRIFAHEALLRGPAGEEPEEVFARVAEKLRHRFDEQCRIQAIERAAALGLREALSVNFMPNALYDPETRIERTLWAADKHDISFDRIIFEMTEDERLTDPAHLRRIISAYRAYGFRAAIDDFGAGYSGLGLLANLQPDYIKLDRALVQGLDTDSVRQTILRGILRVTGELGIDVIAEGIETLGERDALAGLGIDLMQGFLFARPSFDCLVPRAALNGLVEVA
ncbi:MAG: EAL domain-containing protein [Paracoccaceae bacterium]